MPKDNVTGLFGDAPFVRGRPNKDIINLLKAHLLKAEKGEIAAVGIAFVDGSLRVGNVYTCPHNKASFTLLAASDLLHEMVRSGITEDKIREVNPYP